MAALDRYGIEYLIVGGVAVGLHAEPRYTKDLDVLVNVHTANLESFIAALQEYGAPLHFIRAEQFLLEDFVFYFGVAPWRVDILTSIPGVNFEEAFRGHVEFDLGGYPARCISRDSLIQAKLASGRPGDMADLQALRSAPGGPPAAP